MDVPFGRSQDDPDSLDTVLERFVQRLASQWEGEDLPTEVSDALVFIHDNLFDRQIDAATVFEACGFRDHNVSSRFKRAVGAGMHEYISMNRIEMAKQLLRDTRRPILEIAWRVGYAYPETFARSFKRLVGCTATEFRDRSVRRAPRRIAIRADGL